MTDAQFLQTVGQDGVPLLIVYLESRRPVRLPRRVLLSVGLRWGMCMELLGGLLPSVRLVGEPPPRVVARIVLGSDELEFWPGRVA